MVVAIGHLLVALDGSPESVIALQWAVWFAEATQRQLQLVHAWQQGKSIEGPLEAPIPPTGVEGLELDVEDRLRHLAERELADVGIVSEYRALRGATASALLREAARIDANLIVVGASGVGGALRSLLGSVTRELTERPTRAIAVVPEHELPAGHVAPIVVGVDGSSDSSRALRWAGAAARRAGAEVVVVHALELPLPDLQAIEVASLVDEAQQRLEEELCAPLRSLEVPYRAVLEVGDARKVIRRVAGQVQPACVVVGSRGLGAVSQRLLGSITNHLLRELDWPTVVIPSARDCVVWKL